MKICTLSVFSTVKEHINSRMAKEKKKHRVYCTYFPDGRYYIGYSCKTDKRFKDYFGSSKLVKECTQTLTKEIIAEFPSRAPAKMQEFLLQWQQREDDRCVNDMLHVRLRASHLKDFKPIKWEPDITHLATWRNWGVN